MVAKRCGGYEKLITDRVDGLLVGVEDTQAIADALEIVAADRDLQNWYITIRLLH